jgi:hypothetical protein
VEKIQCVAMCGYRCCVHHGLIDALEDTKQCVAIRLDSDSVERDSHIFLEGQHGAPTFFFVFLTQPRCGVTYGLSPLLVARRG